MDIVKRYKKKVNGVLKGQLTHGMIDYQILALVPSLRVLDGQRFDTKFLERKKKQEANFKLMEKKQRLKREKQLKEQGMTAEDDHKRGKKRSSTESELSDHKKKPRDDKSAEDDVDHMKTTKEDHATKKGTKRAAAVKEEQASSENNKAIKRSKTTKHEAKDEKEHKEPTKKKDTFFVPPEPEKTEKRPIPKEKPAVENKPTSKTVQQRSGVVGIVDKTKTQKKGSKKKENEDKQDIVDALLHAEEEEDPTGTGLGIGGWDD